MPAPRVRGDYNQLQQIAQAFASESDRTRTAFQRLKQSQSTLQGGDWIGKGATAFYAEMNGQVMPSMQRLVNALNQAGQVTRQMSQIVKTAEGEAARCFREQGPAGGSGGSNLGSVVGGIVGSVVGGIIGGPIGAAIGSTLGSMIGGSEVANNMASYIAENAQLKAEGSIFTFERGKGGAFSPELGIKYGIGGSVYGDAKANDGWSALGGEIGVKAGMSKDGFSLGAYGEGYAFKAQGDMLFAGDKDLGLTGAGEVKAGAVEGFIGIKDNSFGASIGGTLVSAKGEVGANVAGYNVGVSGEIGLKAELGFSIGKKTEIKLPFITIGFSFGGAKD